VLDEEADTAEEAVEDDRGRGDDVGRDVCGADPEFPDDRGSDEGDGWGQDLERNSG
jgi:hypothetical protein